MKILPSEQVLLKSPGGSLILTTHRVRYETQAMGSGEIISILLEELASCAMVRASQPVLLILAAIAFVLGAVGNLLGGGLGSLTIGVIVAFLFVIFYFGSRRQVLSLASAGATIQVSVVGWEMEMVKDFIEQAEEAKNARYFSRTVAV